MKIERLLSVLDPLVIFLGSIALLSIVGFPVPHCLEGWLIFVFGMFGAFYMVYMLSLVVFWRIDFDWILMNGRFSRKIICIVVLLPFFLTMLLGATMSAGERLGLSVVVSPKELIYEDNLYAVSDSITAEQLSKQESPSLFWAVRLGGAVRRPRRDIAERHTDLDIHQLVRQAARALAQG